MYRASWVRREAQLMSTLRSPAPVEFVARKELIERLMPSDEGAALLGQEDA